MKKNLALIFFFIWCSFAAQVPERPAPPRLYNNLSAEYPQFLSADEADRLEQKLENFSNETSNQICVVVVDDLNSLPPADYATSLINQWGVGKKDKNNGIVILIKPTKTNGPRELFIAVGYGLEGAIPDLATKRIRDEDMNPNLKEGRYYEALDRGTDRLIALAKGEISVKDDRRRSRKDGLSAGQIILVIIILIIFVIVKGGGGGGYTYSGRGRSYWGGGGGSWGGGSSGGGGGWGGFGGGSSGGGGSGGSW